MATWGKWTTALFVVGLAGGMALAGARDALWMLAIALLALEAWRHSRRADQLLADRDAWLAASQRDLTEAQELAREARESLERRVPGPVPAPPRRWTH